MSALLSIRSHDHDGALKVPIMRFTLTYEGELRSNGDPRQKWEIRSYLNPQLQELWRITEALKLVRANRHIPNQGYFVVQRHHTLPEKPPIDNGEGALDLLGGIIVGGREFFPLVRIALP